MFLVKKDGVKEREGEERRDSTNPDCLESWAADGDNSPLPIPAPPGEPL